MGPPEFPEINDLDEELQNLILNGTLIPVPNITIVPYPVQTWILTLSSNTFKFGVRRHPWGQRVQYVCSIPRNGYGIASSYLVETAVEPNSIQITWGAGLVINSVEELADEEVYTVSKLIPSILFPLNYYWE